MDNIKLKPAVCHVNRIRCDECGSLDVKATGTKKRGLYKYWKCNSCGKSIKTLGKQI